MPIGGNASGMDAIGALLASQGGQPGTGQPAGAPPGGAQPPGAGIGPAAADMQQQQLTQTMGQIRDVGEAVKQIAAANPLLGDTAMQIQQLLKQMVVMAASSGPVQTSSGMQVPGGGMA